MANVRKSKTKKRLLKNIVPQEICTINEFLRDIGIKWDDKKEFCDESCIFLLSNLEEEQSTILKEIGLADLGNGFFRFETTKINMNEKLRYIEPIYKNEEERMWREIIDKIQKIERKCPFKPSILQIKLATKWTGNLVKNEAGFKDFVTDLNSFFVESLKNNIEDKYKEHDFWQIVVALRHYYSHDTTRWRDEDKIKTAKEITEFFQNLIGKDEPNTPVSFVRSQLELLNCCSDFLDALFGGT